jgi:hypothetical protein
MRENTFLSSIRSKDIVKAVKVILEAREMTTFDDSMLKSIKLSKADEFAEEKIEELVMFSFISNHVAIEYSFESLFC